MTSISKSKSLANSLRYSRDQQGQLNFFHTVNAKDTLFLESGILIVNELLPDVGEAINNVCDRLEMPRQSVQAYLINDHSANAFCYRYHPEVCRIAVSSGLVNLLEHDELEFVLGHEVGHFLLGHVFESDYRPHPANEAFLSDSRAREISADRVGMHAAGSLDAALRAMIKTQTGLPSKHIRFDVAEFIRMLPKEDKHSFQPSTHPNFYMRARFLLWASMVSNFDVKSEKEKCDEQVTKDLERFFDKKQKEDRDGVIKELRFWINVNVAAVDGVLGKDEQERIVSLGYESHLKRLKSFLSGCSQQDVKERLLDRFNRYAHELSRLDRDGGKSAIAELIQQACDLHACDVKLLKEYLKVAKA
ncbi:MAG: M48 family metallopeptidase [Pseudohongiellaceae bacterium]